MTDPISANPRATCPECGADLGAQQLSGLCPKCLMERGLESMAADTLPLDPGDGPAAPTARAVAEAPGRYTLIGEHARGGMGRVLVVHDESLGRDVALKELLPGDDGGVEATPPAARRSKELAVRFLREAKITGQLEHPGITPVHELGRRPDGALYYTMKLVSGRTLDEAIRAAGSFEKRRHLLPRFVDLCQTISYAHSRGVIHRDVKPSNVLLGEFGETVVVDWGLAKVLGSEPEKAAEEDMAAEAATLLAPPGADDADETRYGEMMGTPAYMSPEQARGRLDEIDELSDVYSLGAVLYQILTGQPPFEGRSVGEVVDRVLRGEPRGVRDVEPRVPRELALVCERALARDRRQRTPSAAALAQQVEEAISTPDVFVNPLRPFLTDLVPELSRLGRLDRTVVVSEASHRWRRKNLMPSILQDLALVSAVLVFAAITMVAFFALAAAAKELQIVGWDEAIWVALTAPGMVLLFVLPIRAQNRSIAPYVREVLRLQDALAGGPSARRARRLAAARKLAESAMIGAGAGVYWGLLLMPDIFSSPSIGPPLVGLGLGILVEGILLARSKGTGRGRSEESVAA